MQDSRRADGAGHSGANRRLTWWVSGVLWHLAVVCFVTHMPAVALGMLLGGCRLHGTCLCCCQQVRPPSVVVVMVYYERPSKDAGSEPATAPNDLRGTCSRPMA